MTVSEYCSQYLFENGLMIPEVVKIMELARQDELIKDIKWEDDIDAYPMGFMDIVIVSLKAVALKYIDANMPQAWFRPMFEVQAVDPSDQLDADYLNVIRGADDVRGEGVG